MVKLWKDWESLDWPVLNQQLNSGNDCHFLKDIKVLHFDDSYETLNKLDIIELKALLLIFNENIEQIK
jgi:hypothetical protein